MDTFKSNSIPWLIIFCLTLSCTSALSQVETGSIPAGTSLIYDVTNLALADQDNDTLSFLDVDGNGTYDFQLHLHCGAPVVDEAHLAKIYVLNDSFSFCIYKFFQTVALYEFDQSICTSGSQEWGNDNDYTVGCNGGFGCASLFESATDKYIGYRKDATSEIGWMKISFDVTNGATPDSIRFSVSEALVLYLQTLSQDASKTFSPLLYPNPTFDGRCFIQRGELITSIAVFDMHGHLLPLNSYETNTFSLPDQPGLYVVRVADSQGQFSFEKVIRM